MRPRVEERAGFPCFRVYRGRPIALVVVAHRAAQPKVRLLRRAPFGAWDEMFYLQAAQHKMLGAQAVAAQFVTTEKLFNTFTSRLPGSQERVPFFEVLIRTVTLAGVAQEPEIIAYRLREN